MFKLQGETSPRIWLEKVELIKKYHGMALVIVHPDYSAKGVNRLIYQDFLVEMKASTDYWHALPREIARWWKQRLDGGLNHTDPAAPMAHARLNEDTLEIVIEHNEYQQFPL